MREGWKHYTASDSLSSSAVQPTDSWCSRTEICQEETHYIVQHCCCTPAGNHSSILEPGTHQTANGFDLRVLFIYHRLQASCHKCRFQSQSSCHALHVMIKWFETRHIEYNRFRSRYTTHFRTGQQTIHSPTLGYLTDQWMLHINMHQTKFRSYVHRSRDFILVACMPQCSNKPYKMVFLKPKIQPCRKVSG